MKVLQIVTILAVIGLAVAFFTMDRGGKNEDAGSAASTSDAKIEALERSVASLTATVKGMQEQVARAAEPSPRMSQSEIDAAVGRSLATREGVQTIDGSMGGSSKKAGVTAISAASFDLRATLDALTNPTATHDDREALWKNVKDSGKIDEVLEAFEERAGSNPENAQMQAELGYAYLQKLQTVTDGPEKGTWAVKADTTFDKALKIDDHNWSARFTKAMSLTFWPPVFGKQPEAIKHFEILIEQQEKAAPKDSFAQSYVFLGNLYSQQGKSEKAQETFKKGLALFPNDEELKKQLGVLESK